MTKLICPSVLFTAALLVKGSEAFSVSPKKISPAFGVTALFSSPSSIPYDSAASTAAPKESSDTQDEEDKAFLTAQFSTTAPPSFDELSAAPVFPSFVAEGHHPAEFESDGGLMMTEHLEPHPKHIFEASTDPLAVSESIVRKMGPTNHPPPFFYFE